MRDNEVCFDKENFGMYIFLLTCIFVYIIYVLIQKNKEGFSSVDEHRIKEDKESLIKKINELENYNHKITVTYQECERVTQALRSKLASLNSYNNNNRNSPPEIDIDSFYNKGPDAYEEYQELGYISNGTLQYPVFGRYKYYKSDKWEYYVINEGRNRVKIVFKTKNDNELYDGDTIIIPQLDNSIPFVFTKYEFSKMRYNPRI